MSDDAPAMRHLPIVRSLVAATLALSIGVAPASTMAAEREDELTLDEALIAEVIETLQERYVDDEVLTSENLSEGAIRGMVEALGDDGHTQYLTMEEYKVEQEVLRGVVAGIGVVLDQRSSAPLVISVVDGSPAARAGLRAGDVIASVDGVETARLPMGELGDLVRGAPGSVVELGIERPGRDDRERVMVERAEVEIDPVSWAMVPGSDVAVIRIIQFSLGAGSQVREALEDALRAGAVGIVLDLRGNPGGLVRETLNAASAFLDEGVAFLERRRDAEPEAVRVDPGRVVDADIPVVVLVDYGTASSGEILAAALRDNERALIVGERTFGTGTILNTVRLTDGSALRLGVSEWLTPAGERVFRLGVAPDEEIIMAPGASRLGPADLLRFSSSEFEQAGDAQLLAAVRLAESAAG